MGETLEAWGEGELRRDVERATGFEPATSTLGTALGEPNQRVRRDSKARKGSEASQKDRVSRTAVTATSQILLVGAPDNG